VNDQLFKLFITHVFPGQNLRFIYRVLIPKKHFYYFLILIQKVNQIPYAKWLLHYLPFSGTKYTLYLKNSEPMWIIKKNRHSEIIKIVPSGYHWEDFCINLGSTETPPLLHL